MQELSQFFVSNLTGHFLRITLIYKIIKMSRNIKLNVQDTGGNLIITHMKYWFKILLNRVKMAM